MRANGGPHSIQLQPQRTGEDRLRAVITTSEQWPVSKNKLVIKYYKNFKQFTDNMVFNKE
jgi:pterin-4a-carbinolamine dehydratase